MTGRIELVDGDRLTIRMDDIREVAVGDRVSFQLEKIVDDWPRRREEIMEYFGVWKNDDDIASIFDEIMAEKAKQAGLGK